MPSVAQKSSARRSASRSSNKVTLTLSRDVAEYILYQHTEFLRGYSLNAEEMEGEKLIAAAQDDDLSEIDFRVYRELYSGNQVKKNDPHVKEATSA